MHFHVDYGTDAESTMEALEMPVKSGIDIHDTKVQASTRQAIEKLKQCREIFLTNFLMHEQIKTILNRVNAQ